MKRDGGAVGVDRAPPPQTRSPSGSSN